MKRLIAFLILLYVIQSNFAQTIKDIDKNEYKTIKIGNQTWMLQNLATSRLNDGTDIAQLVLPKHWSESNLPAYCWYDNEMFPNKSVYGALYNWYAVNTGKLCPLGWHVPSNDEWLNLTAFLGGAEIAGNKLKEQGTRSWPLQGAEADNSSGYTALPGGYRNNTGMFNYKSKGGYWWTSSEYIESKKTSNSDKKYASSRSMDYASGEVIADGAPFQFGYSVRCVRDTNKVDSSLMHRVGEFYGGGIIFRVDNTGQHGLIVSLIDISSSSAWSNVLDAEVGSKTRYPQNGAEATIAIINQSKHKNSAAKLCADYINIDYGTGVYDDWYLPGRGEFYDLYNSRNVVNKILENDGKSETYSLKSEAYWTSTEFNQERASIFSSLTGSSVIADKSKIFLVRAIRAF
jgi:uncharacterized protein (TIGR02145 family)